MARKRTSTETEKVIPGSGNVFTDLGLPNPEERLAKAGLVHTISAAIRASGLTQAEAAERIGLDQPKVSNLLSGKFQGYSMERLFRILNLLGQDVEVFVRPSAEGAATLTVTSGPTQPVA